jgi:hypothetical protein
MRVFFGGIVGCSVRQMLEKSHILHKEIPQPQPPFLLPSQITIKISKERRGNDSDKGGVAENDIANVPLAKGRHPSPPQCCCPMLGGRQRGHDDSTYPSFWEGGDNVNAKEVEAAACFLGNLPQWQR